MYHDKSASSYDRLLYCDSCQGIDPENTNVVTLLPNIWTMREVTVHLVFCSAGTWVFLCVNVLRIVASGHLE